MTIKPDVSIVIPTWNGQKLLAEFLPSVIAAARYYEQQTATATEIIVVDDASQDETVQWLAATYPAIKVVARPHNGGFSTAVNSGFAAAQYPIIFLINNDIRVTETALVPLAKYFAQPDTFAVGCKAYRLHSDLFDGAGKLGLFYKGHWHSFTNYDILPTRLSTNQDNKLLSFVASGGYAAFDREKLRQLGGFCELFSPFYWEDADLCYRAWKRGWQIYYEPTSIVYHQSSATIKKFRSSTVARIAERNRLLMHWINLHDRRWLAAHCGWVLLKLIAAILAFNRPFIGAFLDACRRLPQVRQLRQQERHAMKRSDREIHRCFQELQAATWLVVIHNPADYYRYVQLKESLALPTTLE
jgi:GT2 family glycosyltransferase